MFNTPMVQAHQLRRQAEVFLKSKNYDQSIACHQKSADYYTMALDLATNPVIRETITYQIEHAQKQIKVLTMKKIKDEVDNSEKAKATEIKSDNDNVDPVLKDIMEDFVMILDSLIPIEQKESRNESLESDAVSDTVEESANCSTQTNCNDHVISEKLIINDLKVMSGDVRDATQKLVEQLIDRDREISKLKDMIRRLEIEIQEMNERKS